MEISLKTIFALNIVLLILHEMDAIFWKEWRQFGFKDDSKGRISFLLAHIPLFMIILFGLIYSETIYGRIVSLFVASFLICHYFLHRQARKEKLFDEKVSFGIIFSMLIVSIFQIAATLVTSIM